MSLPMPPVAVERVDRIVEVQEAFWAALRAHNVSPTSSSADRVFELNTVASSLVRDLRREYFPKASHIIVARDRVLRVTPTGRCVLAWRRQ